MARKINNVNPVYPDLTNDFPYDLDTFDKWIDPTLDLLSDINKYHAKWSSGDLPGANAIIENNPMLNRCIIKADGLNKIRDSIIALQRYYMNDVQSYLVEIVKYKKEYSSTTKYLKYNTVYFTINEAQEVYMCIDNNTPIGTLPTDLNYFIPLTMRGQKGSSGIGLTPRGTYVNGTQYYINDMVAHNNALWAANKENLNQVPNKNSDSWYLLIEFSAELLVYVNTISKLQSTTIQGAIDELVVKVNSNTTKIDGIQLTDTKVDVTDKNNHFYATKLDGVLDELFTNANNGKISIATAIGTQVTGNSTFGELATEINEEKRLVAAAAGIHSGNTDLRTQASALDQYVHNHLPNKIVQNGGVLVNGAGSGVTATTSNVDTIYYSIQNLADGKNASITSLNGSLTNMTADRDYWKNIANNSVQKGTVLTNSKLGRLTQVVKTHAVGEYRLISSFTSPSIPIKPGYYQWAATDIAYAVDINDCIYFLVRYVSSSISSSSSKSYYCGVVSKYNNEISLIWKKDIDSDVPRPSIKIGNDNTILACNMVFNLDGILLRTLSDFDSNSSGLGSGSQSDQFGNYYYGTILWKLRKTNSVGQTIWEVNHSDLHRVEVNKNGIVLVKSYGNHFIYNADGGQIGHKTGSMGWYDMCLPRSGNIVYEFKSAEYVDIGTKTLYAYSFNLSTFICGRSYDWNEVLYVQSSSFDNFITVYRKRSRILEMINYEDCALIDQINDISLDEYQIEVSRDGYALSRSNTGTTPTVMTYLKDTYIF